MKIIYVLCQENHVAIEICRKEKLQKTEFFVVIRVRLTGSKTGRPTNHGWVAAVYKENMWYQGQVPEDDNNESLVYFMKTGKALLLTQI